MKTGFRFLMWTTSLNSRLRLLKNQKVQLLIDKQAQMKRDQNCRVATTEVSHAAGILVESQIGGTERKEGTLEMT